MSLKLGTTDISGVPTNLINTVDSLSQSVNSLSNNKAGIDLSNLSSTGKKVIDGQWTVNFNESISTVTSKSSTTIDISSYLPADSSTYDYEVMINLYAEYSSTAGNVAIGTSANPLTSSCFKAWGRVRDTSRSVALTAILPISHTDRNLYSQRAVAVGTCSINFVGYRRIGTNS